MCTIHWFWFFFWEHSGDAITGIAIGAVMSVSKLKRGGCFYEDK